MSIKYYHLAKDEEPPEEFCAVRDIGGEPSEYVFYVPDAENAKLRELVRDMHKALFSLNLDHCQACPREDACVFMHKSSDCGECAFERDMRELGIEVDG